MTSSPGTSACDLWTHSALHAEFLDQEPTIFPSGLQWADPKVPASIGLFLFDLQSDLGSGIGKIAVAQCIRMLLHGFSKPQDLLHL